MYKSNFTNKDLLAILKPLNIDFQFDKHHKQH